MFTYIRYAIIFISTWRDSPEASSPDLLSKTLLYYHPRNSVFPPWIPYNFLPLFYPLDLMENSSSVFQRTYLGAKFFETLSMSKIYLVFFYICIIVWLDIAFNIRNNMFEFWRLNFLPRLPCCYWEILCHCDILSLAFNLFVLHRSL